MNSPPPRKRNVIQTPSLPDRRKTVSLAAFAYLFSELVQYAQKGVTDVQAFEHKLLEVGRSVGYRQQLLLNFKERDGSRDTTKMRILKFVKESLWPNLFGRSADGIEQGKSS